MSWLSSLLSNITSSVSKKQAQEELFQLRHITIGMKSTPELSIHEAQQDIIAYAEQSQKAFGWLRRLYTEKNEASSLKLFFKIKRYEDISDRVEVELANYLLKINDLNLNAERKQRIHALLRIVKEIENVDDTCYRIAKILIRKRTYLFFPATVHANMELMFNLLDGALYEMLVVLQQLDTENLDIKTPLSIETDINNFRDQQKLTNIDDLINKKYTYQASVIYMDLMMECEGMGDHIVHISEAIGESKFKTTI
jgi:phosphate:Na+ symporter